ncbi:hypothetical protein E0I26_12495 [Flavobacterium rhamnosiphilum]|uniref:Uncharacterized protein n=1 Tax=Flavobacterium rhamnosiphilum TaxID=2541724 RepID=A0A4R5F562_9FLAO|nr:hypothetical protein [Flavobacterium rhamnosiphilum]TDE42680.1 hypothetical protein E0I26_12495 [Flavobacterium rhamnosiphilum]
MKFRLLFLILLVSKIGYSQDGKLEDYKVANINNVISLFKQKNIDKISSIIDFPLRREYPIPSIKNSKEFRQRFNEIFDKVLIDKITNSKVKQWSEVGWRGIMLDNGILWIDSTEGKITAVTYQSNFEKKLKKDLIDKEKGNLHISLKIFESPTYKIKTKNYLIRVDKLSDYKYRYASWKIGEKESSKPDLTLKDGKWEFEGSGGNHVITFKNANYIYRVYRNIIGEDNAPDITIEIEKNGKIILTANGTLIVD